MSWHGLIPSNVLAKSAPNVELGYDGQGSVEIFRDAMSTETVDAWWLFIAAELKRLLGGKFANGLGGARGISEKDRIAM